MGDTSLVFNLVARDRASGEVSRFGDRLDAAAAGIGAGFATALGAGVMASLDMEAAGDKLAAQLGLTPEESARMGEVSGSLYADGYSDSLEVVNDAVGAVTSSIKGMADASAADLEAASAAALNFAKTFDMDVAQSVQYVGTLINSGLAADATEGFDLITAASQRVPAHLREDVLEAANEYGQFFQTLGYDGESAFALLVDASAKGMYGIDKAGDAIKEFTVLSTDMSESSQDAYETIGLDAEDMANAILAGGDKAQGATQKIIDGLLGIRDPATQANTAIALFGSPLEDLNVADIPAFLKSLKGASGAMDDFAGASERSGDALNDNASVALQRFKNQVMLDLAAAGGAFAQFAIDNESAMRPLAYGLAGLAALVLTVKGAMIVYSAVSTVVTAAHTVMSASAWTVMANWSRMMALGLMAYARIAASAALSAATTAASWMGSALVSIGTWVAAVVRAALVAVAQFALMAARAVIWAATMAAQWLIAMGPIGWIIAAVIGLVALIIANWDTITEWTGKAWDWVWNKISGIGQQILGFIMNLPIVRWFIQHWDRIKTGTVNKVVGLISYVRGLPHRIGSAIGNLGSLLYGKGRDVVMGLWNGIKGMGSWLAGTLSSWARNLIPGPIARALGIASPSKYMAENIGRWIPAGVVLGIEAEQATVDRTMAGLVQAPPPGAAMAAGRQLTSTGAAAAMTRPGVGGGMVLVKFDFTGADGAFKTAIQKIVRVDGRGDVQVAFGQ
ncbi:phage tail tape measure protein [Streptomyces sanyensis]|uniref:phage tail tape measure protein n=1 Tax=Streptomyces sanyensis TaxID=568869 RepID=UPI003D783A38